MVQGLEKYFVHRRGSAEDVFVAQTFQQLGIHPERYNHFPPGRHYLNWEPFFWKKYTRGLNYTMGQNHSAVNSVAFHYIREPEYMRRLTFVL